MYLIFWAGYKALWAMQVIDDATVHIKDPALCQFVEAKESPCRVPVSMHGTLFHDWNLTLKGSGSLVQLNPDAYVYMYEPESYRMDGGKPAVAGVVIVILLLQILNIWPISRLRNRKRDSQ